MHEQPASFLLGGLFFEYNEDNKTKGALTWK